MEVTKKIETHSYHTDSCPEAAAPAGPVLNWAATIVGVVAPLNALPQIIKIFQTQSVENVSLLMYLIVIGTQAVWLIYAYRLGLMPLLISSVIVVALSGTIIVQFILFS